MEQEYAKEEQIKKQSQVKQPSKTKTTLIVEKLKL